MIPAGLAAGIDQCRNFQFTNALKKAASKYSGNCCCSDSCSHNLLLTNFTTLHGLRRHLRLSSSHVATSFPSSIHNAGNIPRDSDRWNILD